jgi:hypothetical protein
MNSLLCTAIGSRRIVTFYYDGGRRVVEPYCHGSSEAGFDLLRGFQTAGHSSSGATSGWKMFRIEGVSGLAMTDTLFSARAEYDRGREDKIATIYCSI